MLCLPHSWKRKKAGTLPDLLITSVQPSQLYTKGQRKDLLLVSIQNTVFETKLTTNDMLILIQMLYQILVMLAGTISSQLLA